MNSTRDRYDVIVVGAGPGGTMTALMLARRGRKVAIVDRNCFPRFAIGESSTPIVSRVIEQVADDYDIPEIRPLATWGQWQRNLPHVAGGLKRGFTYVDHRNDQKPLVGFHCRDQEMDPSRRLLVAASASDEVGDTHWVRSDVDHYLLECCRRHGVSVRLQHEVVAISNESPWVVTLQRTDEGIGPVTDPVTDPVTGTGTGSPRTLDITCQRLVDASGRSGVLVRKMGYTDAVDRIRTRTSARYSHVTDLDAFETSMGSAAPYRPCSAAVHHLVNDGWVWQLPMSDGRTSLGRVWTNPTAQQRAPISSNLAETLDLVEHPSLVRYLESARLCTTPGRWLSTGTVQHSYQSNQPWSLSMLPLPTTIGTIDPLHSTGLAHAITGAQRVADLLLRDAWEEVGRYEQQVQAEIALIDRVVSLGYRCMANRNAFFSACMLYFAIAIRDEEDRAALGYLADRATWFANQTEVLEVISDMESLLAKSIAADLPPDQQVIERRLRTICPVPLACRVDNLYGYTFA